MTSLSVPAPAPILSPFDSANNTPPRSPQPHRRRASRNPNATALPTFNFNPAQDESMRAENTTEQGSPKPKTMTTEGQRRSPRPTLPEFKFNPGADLPPERSPSPTHPVLQEMALNQQRAVRSARPAPLPAFTFAPHTSSVHGSPSPTKPDFTESQPPRSGHRRGVSEFVGGGTDGPQMVSSSPEKPEYRPPPRMHAHKRSQAVSVSDIDTSELIKANALAKARAGSTPTTPSDAQTFSFARSGPQVRQSMSNLSRTPPSSPRRRDSAPGVRPRVGFSEHVDVIPRPLSMISSETEGSNSTIRGCHSLSGSINSIASPTPRPTLVVSSSSESTNGSPERPQTADALSTLSGSMASGNKSLDVISLPKRPLSASGSPGTLNSGSPPNKKKYFWLSNTNNNVSPLSTPRAENGNPIDVFVAASPQPPKRLEVFGDRARPKTSSGEATSSSRKRKYHTWTSGIFSRKSEKRSSKVKQPPVPNPPTLNRRPSDRLNEIFDADDTIVLREPSPVATRVRPRTQPLPPIQTFSSSPSSEPIMSPVLDLDAALGPFGSEEKFGLDTNSKQIHPSRMAKLHSSERRGTLDAFGTVHRRTESAPIMPAVNRATFGVHRMGSNPSLSEDVFDEEEEDKLLAEENANAMSSAKLVRIQSRAKKPAVSPSEPNSVTLTSKSGEGLGLSISGGRDDDVIIVDAEEDIGRVGCARSSDSTIEAPVFSDLVSLKRPVSSPMTFAYPAPQSQYASSTEGRTTSASMISSPDADHISFDNLSPPTRSHGEISPDFVLRASNDDLPSLSDSISSGALPRFSSSAGTRSSIEHRSASMIVPSTSRSNNQQAWKRASLASLNRLIPGSSNGSKLKFETVPDNSATDEKAKRRSNRISKLLFWRSKDKDEK